MKKYMNDLLYRVVLVILFFFNLYETQSQIKKIGNVSMNDFKIEEKYKNEDAVILFKDRETKLIFENMSGWTLVTTVYERIKINTRKGFDFATKRVRLYNQTRKNDEIFTVNAATYTLENATIKKTKLSRKNIYKNPINNRWSERVFTMPNIKENSIIEWKYTIRSNYVFYIDEIVLQEDIPIKYFRAKVNIPSDIEFTYRFTNRLHAKINTKKGLLIEIWDVPAFTKEKFTRNIELFRPKVLFDVFATNFRYDSYKVYSKSWTDVAKQLNNDDNFGKELKKHKYFVDFSSKILNDVSTKKDSILAVFNFVKNKVKSDGTTGIYTKKGVRKAFFSGNGNVAEINFILISILRKMGFDANPVILSTRNLPEPIFPTILGVNYVVCAIPYNGKYILLDASEKYAGFGVLPFKAVNGIGRLIKKDNTSLFVNLYPNKMATTKKNISVSIDSLGYVSGRFRIVFKGESAFINRKKREKLNTNFLKYLLGEDYRTINIEENVFHNENDAEKSLILSSSFNVNNEIEIIGNKMIIPSLFLFKQTKDKIVSNTIMNN